MLFSSLFKNDKSISSGRGRKRKMTVKDVVDRLDKIELATAQCTLIRDGAGNEKVEDYGQVDVFRLRDEQVYLHENGICITTPTGMKLKGVSGGSNLAQIVSIDEGPEGPPPGAEDGIGEDDEAHTEEAEQETRDPDAEPGDEAEDEDDEPIGAPAAVDAYSEDKGRGPDALSEESETALGVSEVIRLRFFFNRIPYELDCQIVDRFDPVRFKNLDLTPRYGVGYHVRPVSDVRKRDQRRYIRYTHKIGFGHLRLRNEIQFATYAHRTDLEIPEKGVLPQTLSVDDFRTVPFGSAEVSEVKGAEQLENIVEFFMAGMVSNASERRYCYVSKPYLDRLNRSSLEGLGRFNVVGAQQATVLPKVFAKKQPKGKSVLEQHLAAKGGGVMDSRKLRTIEDLHDRYSLQTREQKIWQQRRRRKSVVGNWENDLAILGFSTAYGLAADDLYTTRQVQLPIEITDMGVENITLKPIPFDDARARELDFREFARQEDGFQADLLNFSVGGIQIQGGDGKDEAFLKYLVGDNYDEMSFVEQVECLQRFAIRLDMYPIMNFLRSDIQDYEPMLPWRISTLARVARFRTARSKEKDEPQITSLGLEFIYNPISDSYSRDLNEYDQWEQITPYTENVHFIEVHKALQLLFGFDRAKEEVFRAERPEGKAPEKEPAEKE